MKRRTAIMAAVLVVCTLFVGYAQPVCAQQACHNACRVWVTNPDTGRARCIDWVRVCRAPR